MSPVNKDIPHQILRTICRVKQSINKSIKLNVTGGEELEISLAPAEAFEAPC